MHFHDGLSHEHGEGHTHTHGDVTAFESVEQAIALMSYMLDHNKHHAEELHELSHKLEATGKENAAQLIGVALEKYYAGNEDLEKALNALKEGK